MNRSTTKPSYLISSFRSFTACSSSPFFLPTVPPLSPSSRLTDDSDSSIILEHVFYCQGPISHARHLNSSHQKGQALAWK